MNRFVKTGGFVLALALLGFVVFQTQSALDRSRTIRFVDTRPVFLPKGEVLKWLSMGYRGLMSDWLWIRTVLYYGRRVMEDENPYFEYAVRTGSLEAELNKVRAISAPQDTMLQLNKELAHLLYRGEHRGLVVYIYPMLERITTIDPHFIFPYIFGGIYVLMDTGEVDAAQRLLEKGLRANPERWEFSFYLGWIEWMYKGNLERTNQYLMEAVGKEDCPEYVGSLFTGLSRRLGHEDMTKLYLESMLESTDNPDVRKRIQELIEHIEN